MQRANWQIEIEPVVAGGRQPCAATEPPMVLERDPKALAAPRAPDAPPPPVLQNDLSGLASTARLGARSSRVALWLVSSLVLHFGTLVAHAMWWAPEEDPGAIAQQTDAISVELVASNVLEAITTPAKEAAAQSVATAAPEGNAPEDQQANTPSEPEPEPPKPEPPKQVVLLDPMPALPQAAPDVPAPILVEPTKEQPNDQDAKKAEEEKQKREEEARRERERQKVAEKRREDERKDKEKRKSARKGGATARASAGSTGGGGKVSASTGQIQSYAATVRARVASHKPAGDGNQGTVVVYFSLSPSGGLRSASVSRSSGRPGLDRLALSAIRSAAPFPTPPAGAAARQLSFSIPFHFQ
jgi:protein TonB